jgi:ribosomal protein S18 acetylase RimI-like enzyme
MAELEGVEIAPVSVEDLRRDSSGTLVKALAALAYHAFREPPWSSDLEEPRLHFGLGVELMRRNARAWIARTNPPSKVVGYILGYEVFREREDPRDLTLCEISGTKTLDYLFEGGRRVFYGDTLCVDPGFRRRHIAYKLSAAQIDMLRAEGFTYRIGRTAITGKAMRALYTKLGFQELSVHDILYPERTYWLLRL